MGEDEIKLPFDVPVGIREKKDYHRGTSVLVSIRLSNDLKVAVDTAARAAGVSRNAWIAEALNKHLGRTG